ncbi:MAG TPA: GNAT family N-acetyltransferase [Actinoplanes sp.]
MTPTEGPPSPPASERPPPSERRPPSGPWAEVAADVPEDLVRLARRCLVADGGLPLAGDPGFLRRRWGAVGGVRFGLRGSSGELVAAGAVCPGADGPIVTGLVDPAARGCGVGGRLLDHALAVAGSLSQGVITVETESLTARASALLGSRGLRAVFAEDVLWIDLTWFDAVPRWPAGTAVTTWTGDLAERFFEVYTASFRGRPGFPGPTAAEWIAENEADDEFRPGWSLLAYRPGIGDAGFLTAAVGWIVQVGVVPAARRRGLGRALVTEALHRMATAGEPEAWLTVNVNNPGAAHLYQDLGFTSHGRRARYQP